MATVLWWGRFDPQYSRNRILRKLLAEQGWQVSDFQPRWSAFAGIEAYLCRLPRPDLVWVPCFRQRDVMAASRWARSRQVPLLFDPLISAYDKQVDERAKLAAGSFKAARLLAWERGVFARADAVMADTPAHADYFHDVLEVPRDRLGVVYVGAETALFTHLPPPIRPAHAPLEVLFYGSFIPLQGPEVVVEAARLSQDLPVNWTLLGQGPLRKRCEAAAQGLKNVTFEDWLPYEQLAARIAQADILLGVFGTTPKAGRVIPNKVYQSLACGRPVVTRHAEAYPVTLASREDSGLIWVPSGDAGALARCVRGLVLDDARRHQLADNAVQTSQAHFSETRLRQQLQVLLNITQVRR